MRPWIVVGHRIVIVAALMVAFGLAAPRASAQPNVDALKADLERVKGEIENLKSEMRLIREVILQRLAQPAAPAAPTSPPRAAAQVSGTDNPALGKNNAEVTLVEFSDYQCPFCRRFFENTLPTLKKDYIETGKVRYVFRDFPLDSIHPQARKASEAAHCAGEQGKYWEMHDTLFQNQQALQVDHFKTYAERLKLDVTAFRECVDKGKYASKVQKNYADGTSAGVQGTPAFYINGRPFRDWYDGERLRRIVSEEIKKAKGSRG